MGCEQSDIVAFTNMLTASEDGQQHPPQNQQRNQQPAQQNPFVQAQPQYQQTPQPYQQPAQPYQQPAQPYQQPVQPYQQPSVNYSQPPPIQQVKVGGSLPADAPKKRKQPREYLEHMVNFNDDFLTHHLKYELTLSKYSSTKRIKRRQVLEHIMLQNYWGNVGGAGINSQAYFESLISSWMQRTFMDIWEEAHDEFFNQHVEEKLVRRKIAEQYMFEIYELKEYVDSGLGNLNALIDKTRCSLTEFMQFSDDALFSLFKKLKDRYPQTGATEKIKFPDVPSTKTNINLLDHFSSKCFVDPEHINIQTIFSDLNFMMSKAIEEQQDFKSDMKEILGEDVLACPKVMQTNKEGKPEFNACAVRRVFIKWAENLLQKCPDLQMSKAFTNFVQAKFKITDNFFFKSTIQATTHKHVIDSISYLLDVAKYSLDTNEKRKEFIFNIYDLLRCKIKRNSAELVVGLLKRMQDTKITKSGRKFEVIRVKNRFETNNRDLLINFRYGDILIGEAQLCIDDANVSKLTKLNYEFCHYIYELERSLFGPTLELMMQYEDHQRPDISVNFAAEDVIKKRGIEKIKAAEKTDRKCLQGHEMISLVGNYFFGEDVDAAVSASCNYCDRMTTSDVRYDFCFHCGCFLCRECSEDYKKANFKTAWLSVQRDQLAIAIKDESHLRSECASNKSLIVIFHSDDIAPSQVFKDAIIYHQSKLSMQLNKTLSKIAVANFNVHGVKNLCAKLQIREFPTTILFDSSTSAVRTIIGASWLQVPFLYETHKRIIKGESIQLPINCAACQQTMNFAQLPEDQQLVCLNCFNNATPLNLPAEYHRVGAFCGQGHYRCIQCSYTALDIPSVYRDPTGTNYLSSSFTSPKLQKCPKGHATKFTKTNLLQAWEYECFSCRQRKMFDNENGMAVCETCKVGQCPKCLGCPLPTFHELQNGKDLALHYVESTAQQGCQCACGRHFKKVYNTRSLSVDELANQKSADNKNIWKCTLCQKAGKEGQLHVACFNCPSFSKVMEKKYNFEICITCATVSEILQKETKTKVVEVLSFFICPKAHQMVKTTQSYKFDLSYNCMFCSTKYYANTERLYCKTCNTNCCQNCLQRLYNANPPRCNQLCPSNHQLKLVYKVDDFKFCDGCMKVLKSEYFECAQNGYSLCTPCANRPPGFIGTAFEDCRNGMLKQKGLLPSDYVEEGEENPSQAEDHYNFNWGAPQEEAASEENDFGFDINDFF